MSETTQTDTSTNPNDYQIDVTQFEFDIENRSHDSTNNVTYCVKRIKGTDLWVAWSSSPTGPNEVHRNITGIGRLTLEGASVRTGKVAALIREKADEIREHDEEPELLALADELDERAEEVAEELAEAWQDSSADYVVGDALYEGGAAVDGASAWVGHQEEAMYFEAEDALAALGIENDEWGAAKDIAVEALYRIASMHSDSWFRPHLEYKADLSFDIEAWELRALELVQNGVFRDMMETARVQALRETGVSGRQIAEKLDVNPSTVTRHSQRADEWMDRAEWTAANCSQN